MVRLTRNITIFTNGKEYNFVAGDVINPDMYPGIDKHIGAEYSDRMVRRAPVAEKASEPKKE